MKSRIIQAGIAAMMFSLPFFAHAQWTAPTLTPPSGNVSSPLNVGSTGQIKLGGLTLCTGGCAPTGLVVYSGNVGIGATSPAYKLDVNGDVIAGWLRTRGDTGWYSETYGGGWYMMDGTWIRAYNNKPVYMSGGFDTGGGSGIGCSGGMGGGIYSLRVCGTLLATGAVTVGGTLSSTGALAVAGTAHFTGGGSDTWFPYSDGSNYIRGNVRFNGTLFDETNQAYYLNPDGTSVFNAVYASVFYYNSDRTLKKDIAPLQDSLSKILKLDGVSFKWKDAAKGTDTNVGFIAQDVEKVYPNLVHTDAKTGLKSVEYGNLVAPLVEAIKAQQKEIDALKAEVEALKK